VSQETIDGPGVVSEACALEMARGARRIYDADIGVALTGVAGPEPHDGQPVGTIWAAIATDEAGDHAASFKAPGDRAQVRRWAEQAALDLLRRHLERLPQLEDRPEDPFDASQA
jgi:nicotinamide-nucleotide amidase